MELNKKYKELTNEECRTVIGGHWIGDILGAIGGAAHPVNPQKVVNQLNGRPAVKPRSCSPYGTGGTPNSCNW